MARGLSLNLYLPRSQWLRCGMGVAQNQRPRVTQAFLQPYGVGAMVNPQNGSKPPLDSEFDSADSSRVDSSKSSCALVHSPAASSGVPLDSLGQPTTGESISLGVDSRRHP